MNAKDIAKALKCCYPPEGNNSCDGCPYDGKEPNCIERNIEYHAGEIIESLLSQLDAAIAGQEKLAESQRRERAAVEDILVAVDKGRCVVCKYHKGDGLQCEKWPDRSCWEWRGPAGGRRDG